MIITRILNCYICSFFNLQKLTDYIYRYANIYLKRIAQDSYSSFDGFICILIIYKLMNF